VPRISPPSELRQAKAVRPPPGRTFSIIMAGPVPGDVKSGPDRGSGGVSLDSIRQMIRGASQVEGSEEKQVPPPEGPAPNRRIVVQARSTAVAVPPGKRNGREHQDLRRRHLLVREIGNDPRTSRDAVPRPLRKHSAHDVPFHHSI